MNTEDMLESLRKQIDDLDSKIVKLLNDRAGIAQRIGEVKRQTSTEVYHPNREQQVYERVLSENKGPLPNDSLRAIYRELMAGSRALEKPLKVSYLGPAGTFSFVAARKSFGASVEYLPQRGIDAVFREVEAGRANYGIAPAENSTEGSIRETLNMFQECNVKIYAEVVLPIHHSLVACGTIGEVKRIYSKLQVFSQCKNWLSSNFPEAELLEVGSTTEAAQIAKKESNAAAIAHAEVAELYGLNPLYSNIEDSPNNVTRFYVLSKSFSSPSGKDKTAIMCYIKNQVGALYDILRPFKKYAVNLTSIESLPSRRKAWDYSFYIELEGHVQDENIKKALEKVSRVCLELKVLGSFPRGNQFS
ncbi:MAG TPA: prephenate dehydratase [Candidatus Avalokitesvara rifleensis]|uniref:prephenate dehydratase n=1 Tax=Candidatus Avalokitesvara rifleensis TaxID=3367620 RepID=UPI00271238E9|nr:prephenate dehydratase [Candidatus Brocadiales bacterium]